MWNDELLKKDIYQIAFTHRSFLNEHPSFIESNERLEFPGDAVLSFIISSYLFEVSRGDAEDDLTALMFYIVKTTSLAQAAKKLKLGKLMKLSKGEELSGGRENTQLLANTYEALLGGVFTDQGLEGAKKFVMETLTPLFEREIKFGPPKDSKSL